MGVMDFAGGLVVHTTAGVTALVIVKILGSRSGFPRTIKPPHSPVIAMIGAAMLWVGWFGFNAGSALGANQSAAMAMLVTHISAASATITWMAIDWYKNGKPGLVGMITGMVAGLATVTPASGYIGPIGGLILGISSGVICYWFVGFVKNIMGIDDSLDVFAVHGVGGMLGTILCGWLISSNWGGVGFDEGKTALEHVKTQSYAVLVTLLWTVFATFIILKIISLFIPLRVDEEDEIQGLDTSAHGESGYNN